MSSEPVDFWGGPFGNFAPSVIQLAAYGALQYYDTVEHRFQAMKATNRADHELVRTSSGPGAAKAAGRLIRLRPDWDEVRYDVMVEALRVKFMAPSYRTLLLKTGDREIREDSPTDFIWGYRNGGLNLLGKALMQVRAEIKEDTRE